MRNLAVSYWPLDFFSVNFIDPEGVKYIRVGS